MGIFCPFWLSVLVEPGEALNKSAVAIAAAATVVASSPPGMASRRFFQESAGLVKKLSAPLPHDADAMPADKRSA